MEPDWPEDELGAPPPKIKTCRSPHLFSSPLYPFVPRSPIHLVTCTASSSVNYNIHQRRPPPSPPPPPTTTPLPPGVEALSAQMNCFSDGAKIIQSRVKMKARPACEWLVSGISDPVCRKVERRRFCNGSNAWKTGLRQMRQRAAHVALSEPDANRGGGCVCNSKMWMQVGF